MRALGACALDAVLIGSLLREVPLRTVAADWHTVFYLLISLILATLLGCIVGAMFMSGPVRIVCSKINGAPLGVGDQVIVISGRHKGTIAEVHDIIRGQGGWELARLDLGAEARECFRDIFEEYQVFRTRRGEHFVQ